MNNKIVAIKKGQKLDIAYGVGETKFGNCLIAWSGQDLCFLGFTESSATSKNVKEILRELENAWTNCRFLEDNKRAKAIVEDVFLGKFNGNLLVTGTDFQIKVWDALINITPGETVSYQTFANSLLGKNYTRAVASAIASNNISYLIPCHRVVHKSGRASKYRWGSNIKKELLIDEKIAMPTSASTNKSV
ncbi:MAG: hypothetical protein Tsb006_0090 [Rickettsiaceae bacterium]